jgi:hypothetical protein
LNGLGFEGTSETLVLAFELISARASWGGTECNSSLTLR